MSELTSLWQNYRLQIALACVAGFVLSLVLWPNRKPVPEVLDNIHCAGEALAISEYAVQRKSAGNPLDPSIAERIEAHADQSIKYLRGLRRRDDPAVIEIPDYMNSAQTTRDAMLERDPAWYVSDTMDRIDACVPRLSSVSSL